VKILVTGGGGFAGRHLLRSLQEVEGAELAATVLGTPPVEPVEDLKRVQWLEMDVGSEASIREVIDRVRPDQVYHLAGQASVGRSLDAPLETWEINATGTLRLLAALSDVGGTQRMLMVSSAEVYGHVDAESQPIGEDAPFRPVTPYGSSKAAAELIAWQMGAAAGVDVVVARSFNHIGPGQDDRFVLPSMARQLVQIRRGEGAPVLLVGNLEVERDFLDVRDVATAYRCLMDRGVAGVAYNISSGVPRSLLAVVRRLLELSRAGARLEVDPERLRAVDIPLLVGDPGRIRGLGWVARFELDQTLRDLLREAEERA
jgi:GDP-4-dehydro-6-deoxy-D-mannose reductase